MVVSVQKAGGQEGVRGSKWCVCGGVHKAGGQEGVVSGVCGGWGGLSVQMCLRPAITTLANATHPSSL